MRGEYFLRPLPQALLKELPPHARRIPFGRVDKPQQAGTTSACAENTKRLCGTRTPTWNYLRMRGEYILAHNQTSITPELPPHARRIPFRQIVSHCNLGTTSACAENTGDDCDSGRAGGNYLRMRGEYTPSTPTRPGNEELPPHARRILGRGI